MNSSYMKILVVCTIVILLATGCATKTIENEPDASTQSQTEPQEQIEQQPLEQAPSITPSPFKLAPLVGQTLNLFNQGSQALQDGDYLKAQSDFEKVLALEPTHSATAFNLALAYLGQEKPDSAKNFLNKAIEFDSTNIHAMNQLAVLHRQSGAFEDAKSLWMQAITVWPDYPQAHYNIAILYDLYMGQFDLALKHYQQYQSYQDEPDRLVKAWIADVSRRLNSQ